MGIFIAFLVCQTLPSRDRLHLGSLVCLVAVLELFIPTESEMTAQRELRRRRCTSTQNYFYVGIEVCVVDT